MGSASRARHRWCGGTLARALRGTALATVSIYAQCCSARGTCRKGCTARRKNPCWRERPPTRGSKDGLPLGISKWPMPKQSPATRAEEERPFVHWRLCCSHAYVPVRLNNAEQAFGPLECAFHHLLVGCAR